MASRSVDKESFTWRKVEASSSIRSLHNPGLLDIVFSWTIRDTLNNKLYKNKVKQIPMTFSSPADYLNSFKTPLVEETRANLYAGLETLSANNNPSSSSCEISSIEFSKGFKPPKNLYYNISIKDQSRRGKGQAYQPEPGDIFAITQAIPRCIGDLSKTEKVMLTPCNYLLAFVESYLYKDSYDEVRVRASREIDVDRLYDGECERLFATYLMNMTTNLRIWNALEYTKGRNLTIIGRVLKHLSTAPDSGSKDECTLCHTLEKSDSVQGSGPSVMDRLSSFNLNEAQRSAVLSIISMKNCSHNNDVLRLIWGPPGTGKTKTVASLLFLLLNSNCRTLACAPTNMAILQVAERFMKLLVNELDSSPYCDCTSPADRRIGLGDVVLFGNKKRMTIMDDEDHELLVVFLDYRANILAECLSPFTGLKQCLDSMVSFLEDPRKQYNTYLQQFGRGGDDGSKHVDGECGKGGKGNGKSSKWKAKGVTKDNTKMENHNRGKGKKEKEKITIKKKEKDKITIYQKRVVSTESSTSTEPISFEGFARKRYDSLEAKLLFCINGLYTHLPISCTSVHTIQEMIRVLDQIRVEGITNMKREEGLRTLKTIPSIITDAKLNDMIKNDLPKLKDHDLIVKLMRDFCLYNARLIFCTASSSTKMHKRGKLDMVVIDEAAQLKECEAAIPLQLPGVRHAVLIGDDKQLPAMVQSKISENAGFGRSLFERLVLLDEKKLLLNVQYRMHPSISQFPNKEFYENQILNAPNVEERSYERHLLPDKMYGSYSFINIDNGKEDFSQGHSPRNMMEVAVVDHILSRLFNGMNHATLLIALDQLHLMNYQLVIEIGRDQRPGHVSSKQKVSVGVISPYKGQVSAIQEKLGKKYSSDKKSSFCVSARTVDGFQGGEEDVIIISTVRCNSKGSIGFLSNYKRTNVSLTRARYCLWVLGSGATLVKSRSIWTELVIDAEKRRCYHDADEDKELHEVIFHTLIHTRQFHALLNSSSLQLDQARWKVSFTDTFWKSMRYIESTETCKNVLCLLRQIAGGWRRGQQRKGLDSNNNRIRMCSGSPVEVEKYKVDSGKLFLIWSIDIHHVENSRKQVQVIKVWDVLPKTKIDGLIMTIQKLYGNSTVDTIQRCQYKSTQGDLVVPMSWHVKSIRSCNDLGSTADSEQCMSTQFASLSLH